MCPEWVISVILVRMNIGVSGGILGEIRERVLGDLFDWSVEGVLEGIFKQQIMQGVILIRFFGKLSAGILGKILEGFRGRFLVGNLCQSNHKRYF